MRYYQHVDIVVDAVQVGQPVGLFLQRRVAHDHQLGNCHSVEVLVAYFRYRRGGEVGVGVEDYVGAPSVGDVRECQRAAVALDGHRPDSVVVGHIPHLCLAAGAAHLILAHNVVQVVCIECRLTAAVGRRRFGVDFNIVEISGREALVVAVLDGDIDCGTSV